MTALLTASIVASIAAPWAMASSYFDASSHTQWSCNTRWKRLEDAESAGSTNNQWAKSRAETEDSEIPPA